MGIDSKNPYKDYGGSIDKGWQEDTPSTTTSPHMVLATSRPQTVEAIRYGPEFRPGLVNEVAEFIAGRKLKDHEVIEYVEPDVPWEPPEPEYSAIRIRAGKEGAQGWVTVPLGHWIVRSEGDLSDHWPVEHEYFSSKYMY